MEVIYIVLTDLTWLSPGQSFPPKSEVARIAKYERNFFLWKGDHEAVFPQLNRMFRDSEAEYKKIKVILNWPKRLSLLWPDLLFGEKPRVKAGEPGSREQMAVDRILSANHFWSLAHIAAIDASRYGDGILKVRFDINRGVIIEVIPPRFWFPIVDPSATTSIKEHVLAWVINRNVGGVDTKFLRVEVHEPGLIINRIFRLSSESKIMDELPWPFFDEDKDIEAEQETKVDYPLIVPIHNLCTSDDVFGEDDYTDIIPILRRIETRLTRVGRILDHHSEPMLTGPLNMADINPITGEVTIDSEKRTLLLNSDDKDPKYLTWDGQIQGSISELEFLKGELYSLSETCPTAFGEALSGTANSGTALRLRLMTPLKKAERLRSISWDQGIKDVLYIASLLEVAMEIRDAVPFENINITWYDGLPIDEVENIQNEVTKVTADISSRRSAIKRLGDLDDEAAQLEMDQIAKEKLAGAPPEPEVPPANPLIGAMAE